MCTPLLLEVKGLYKSYTTTLNIWQRKQRKTAVLKNVSFDLNEHQIVGLIGKSGCGKSTIARLIVCLEKPDKGNIIWDGKSTNQFTKHDLRSFWKSCQFIHQDSLSSFNPSLTMKDSLLEPLRNHSQLTKKACENHIEEMLPSLHLNTDLLKMHPRELSGGQRQRFNILRALLVDPKLLICDEITAGLDKIAEAKIIKLLTTIQQRTGMAILFISHDLRLVQRFCHQLLVMENGEIVEKVEKVANQFSFQHPHTSLLFQSLPINHPAKRAF